MTHCLAFNCHGALELQQLAQRRSIPSRRTADHPTKLYSNEIRGAGVDRNKVRYYLSVVGGPGQVKLTFDFAPQSNYQSASVTVYDEDFAKIDDLSSSDNERKVKHIQMNQQQTLILEIILDSGDATAATFLLRVEGAVRFQ